MRLRSSAWWAWQLEKLQRSLRSRPEDRREEADGARGGEKIKEILRGRHMAEFFSTQVRKTPDQVSPASGSRFRDAAYQKAVLHAARAKPFCLPITGRMGWDEPIVLAYRALPTRRDKIVARPERFGPTRRQFRARCYAYWRSAVRASTG